MVIVSRVVFGICGVMVVEDGRVEVDGVVVGV